MKIPFMRLDRQYALHKDEILSICDNVFSHGRVLQGKEVDSLENKLSEIHRSKHSVAVNSGTDALYFALLSLGILPKDKRQIFKPGYSTKSRGWGLGLSLTKRIIENINLNYF